MFIRHTFAILKSIGKNSSVYQEKQIKLDSGLSVLLCLGRVVVPCSAIYADLISAEVQKK